MKVTDKVYALESTKGNYAYIILDRETIMIDTGRPGQGESILKELKSMGIEPGDIKHILLTHHDIDHIGNAALLQQATGAAIWASKEDLPYINGELKRAGIKKILQSFIKIVKPEGINTYDENKNIGQIKIIKTPGHTPGHVCLLYNDVLFAGDLVTSVKGKLRPSPSIMTWDKTALMKSINKAAELKFKWICPAHGVPVVRDANGGIL